MGDVLRSMQVELGWAVDTSGQSAAEAAVKATEDRITAANAAALAKRAAQENQARQERIAADLAAGRKISEDDKVFSVEMERRRKAATEEAAKREEESFKRSGALRKEQFNEVSKNFLHLNDVAHAFTTGLSGAIGALPFGAMILGVTRTASGLSDLAVQAQRVGSSASHIQRFVYGMRYAGLNEGQANSALEGFAGVVKSNEPAFRKALEGMQIKTTDANGKPLDIEQLEEAFGHKLAGMDYTQARMVAQGWGITDPDALNAFRNGQFAKGTGDYDDRAKAFGFDADKAAEDARNVDKAWLRAKDDFDKINTQLQSEFFTPVLNGFDALAKKMEENPAAVEKIGRAMEGLGVLMAAKTLPPLANLVVKLSGLEAILGGSVGTLLGIATNPIVALGASAESTPGAGVPADAGERAKVAEENRRLTDEANRKQGSTGSFWQDSLNYIKNKLGFGDDRKVKDDIAAIAESTKKLADRADGFGGGVTASSGGLGGSGTHAGGGSFPGASLGDHARGGIGRNAAQMAAGARESFNFWVSKGLTREQAAGLVGMEQGESGFNPRIVGDGGAAHGAFQWHPDRRARILAATGINVDTATHGQQLEAAYWEFTHTHQAAWNAVRQGRTATDAARSGVYLFEAPKDKAGQSIVRGGMGEGWLKRFAAEDAAKTREGTPSTQAISDAEVFAARQRLMAGGRDPKDIALRDAYLKQQNGPVKVEVAKPVPLTPEQHEINRRIVEHARNGTLSNFLLHGRAHVRSLADMQRVSFNSSHLRQGDFHSAGDTFNINARDAKSGLDAAQKLSAHRQYAERIRYGQRAQV